MNIHEKVRAKIEAEVPCYAQGIIGGRTVSYHPDFTGFGMTYSDKFSASDMTTTAVKFLLIDQWVEGEARASPKTFSRKELEFRAREHNYGNGHEILPGDVNKELARKILEFADAHPDLLADEPCPH